MDFEQMEAMKAIIADHEDYKEAGRKIDPETAEVCWEFAFECARSPGSDVWVDFCDLPAATRAALFQKHRSVAIEERLKIDAEMTEADVEAFYLKPEAEVMTDEEAQAWLAIRKEAGRKIDPETAEVMWEYGQELDPYGIGREKDIPRALRSINRQHFARSPGSDVWVHFCDLPDATRDALYQKHKSRLRAFSAVTHPPPRRKSWE